MISRKACAVVCLFCAATLAVWPAKKKKKEEETQTLQLPKELPSVVMGETRRLTFYVTPLSAKGLLSQQVRDALRALDREDGDDTVLQIRAFVAGSGDLRRVRDLISETFTERRQPLPVVSIIQSGGLPLSGAQVVLEAVAASRKDLHPGGLAWISAQTASVEDPLAPVPPLAEQSLASLRTAVKAAGAEPAAVLRATCFLSSLDKLDGFRTRITAEYPHAALNLVQTQREPVRAVAGCEAVAAPRQTEGSRLDLLSPPELPHSADESQIALIRTSHTVFTSAQVSFGFEDRDARLAFDRMQKELQQAGVSPTDVAFVRFYPLSQKIADQVRRVRPGFAGGPRQPAGSLLLFEGLSSLDAGFAVDVVAAKD
jgi:enamine deaminase RidA (YjgF/YER057c/UK114 family)